MTYRTFAPLTALALVGCLCGVSAAAEIAIFTDGTGGETLVTNHGNTLTHSFDAEFRNDIPGL